jgi:hypothetical protein
MKAIKSLISAAAIALCSIGAVQAASVTSVVNPSPDAYITTYTPYTYTHDLTGTLNPGDTINEAKLKIFLYDPTDLRFFAFPETVIPIFNGTPGGNRYNVPRLGSNYYFDLTTSLLNTGLLEVTLKAGCSLEVIVCLLPQDYKFDYSTLYVDYTPVPEPVTLLTFGAGLLGLGAMRRRKAAARTEQGPGAATPA